MRYLLITVFASMVWLTSCSSSASTDATEKGADSATTSATASPSSSPSAVVEAATAQEEESPAPEAKAPAPTAVGEAQGKMADQGGGTGTTISGSFRSLKGVMNPLSCYCYNCGYITTVDGEKVAVCFTNDDLDVNCSNIKVTGVYATRSVKGDDGGACPAGQQKVLETKSFTCE